MLGGQVSKLLNVQIVKEFYSAYLYLDMAGYYEDQGLTGFSHWFMVQAQEERDHALLFVSYLQNNGTRPAYGGIEGPNIAFSGFKAPLEAALAHERTVTESINAIYEAAFATKDFRTMQFLDWFIKEQGEEEKNTEDLCKKYDLFAGDPKGLYSLDAELAARVYTAPSLAL